MKSQLLLSRSLLRSGAWNYAYPFNKVHGYLPYATHHYVNYYPHKLFTSLATASQWLWDYPWYSHYPSNWENMDAIWFPYADYGRFLYNYNPWGTLSTAGWYNWFNPWWNSWYSPWGYNWYNPWGYNWYSPWGYNWYSPWGYNWYSPWGYNWYSPSWYSPWFGNTHHWWGSYHPWSSWGHPWGHGYWWYSPWSYSYYTPYWGGWQTGLQMWWYTLAVSSFWMFWSKMFSDMKQSHSTSSATAFATASPVLGLPTPNTITTTQEAHKALASTMDKEKHKALPTKAMRGTKAMGQEKHKALISTGPSTKVGDSIKVAGQQKAQTKKMGQQGLERVDKTSSKVTAALVRKVEAALAQQQKEKTRGSKGHSKGKAPSRTSNRVDKALSAVRRRHPGRARATQKLAHG